MSNYKYPTPQLLLKAICNAIRAKTGSNDKIAHQDIPDSINNILTEEECEVESQKLLDIIYGKDMKILDNKYISNIPYGIFYYNSKITTVNLPKCTSIGGNAFENCTSLTTVDLPKCTSIGDHAFRKCVPLTIINLPKCTSIGNYAFYNCTNLTTINLPECTTLGYQAFKNCTSLTTVNLPKCTSASMGPGLEDFGAFYNCTNLTIVILGNGFVSRLPSMFGATPIADGTGYIYVPDNVLDEYRSRNPRYQFKPISELPSNLKEEYGYE